MRFDSHVWRLHRNIDRQVGRIKNFGSGQPLNAIDVSLIERSILQLQVEWEHFVRCFVLDCATGRFEDTNGRIFSRLALRSTNRERVSHILMSSFRKRRREPDWYLPDQAIDAADRLRLSNSQKIATLLGVTPWVLDDLRHLRNFVVHQSKDSALEARKRNLVTASNQVVPAHSALSYGVGGARRVDTWSAFMKTISRSLL